MPFLTDLSYLSKLLLDIKAGTSFGRTGVAMPDDASCGIALQESLHEVEEGSALLGGSRVGRLALSVQSAFVADAKGTAVVAAAMRSGLRLGATVMHDAVACDVVMIADALESALSVPAVDVLHGGVLLRSRSAAMDDEILNVHSVFPLVWHKGTSILYFREEIGRAAPFPDPTTVASLRRTGHCVPPS